MFPGHLDGLHVDFCTQQAQLAASNPTTTMTSTLHRCSCSTRALETLVKELAGIDLRRHRAQRFFQHSRALSTRPPTRHVATVAHTHADHGFVSFQPGSSSSSQSAGGSARSSQATTAGTQGDPEASQRKDEGDREWHAEIETMQPGRREETEVISQVGTIDSVRLPDPGLELACNDVANPVAPILHLPAISQRFTQGDAQPMSAMKPALGSKTTSRKLRKARRIEAGTYKPAADSRLTALDKIEMLEGPSMKQKAEQPMTHELETKSAAQNQTIDGKRRSKATVGAKGVTKMKENNTGSSKHTAPSRTPPKDKTVKKETWQIQKAALDRKFAGQGWQPRKRLSPDTLEGIRALHASDPASYSTATLAEHFQITPEAIRRVLRSKWRPKPEEIEDRMKRWENRGLRKWEEMSATGVKPPKRWRDMGVQNPLLKKKLQKKERSNEAGWNRAEQLADRLPFGGSFAERLL